MVNVEGAFESKVDRSADHHLWLGATDKGGRGQIRIDGTLRTATSVAWELSNGAIPEGFRVRGCPDSKVCVRAEHLELGRYGAPSQDSKNSRGKRGAGTITKIKPGKWKLTVDAGRDETGRRRRLSRTVRGTKSEASKALAAFTIEVRDGDVAPLPASGSLTVSELVAWYVGFAREVRGLERTTVFGYQEVYDHWLANQLGHIDAERLTPAQLDNAFGRMRAAGKSRSRMVNARAVLSGAYKWGRRHDKVHANPMRDFELPKSSHVPKPTIAPELAEVVELLNQATELSPEFAPVLKLAAATGMRRGEISALRRDRVDLEKGQLRVERAISEIKNRLEEKPTKNHQNRTLRLDEFTINELRNHFASMDERAELCGTSVAEDSFVFSLESDCSQPMRPELLTARMRRLRNKLGVSTHDFNATILSMRKWTTTELMDAGFNPAAISGRQGHTVQVMLNNYASRRQSADQAAADHLGSQLFGNGPAN